MTILNGDAINLIKEFEDESFDLIILDPDYQDWESIIRTNFLFECLRSLKPDGNIICFTKQPFDYKLRIEINDIFRREIIWTFNNGGAWCSNKLPLISFQKIYWCVKSPAFFFNPRTGLSYSGNTKDFKRKEKVFGGYKSEGKDFVVSEEGTWLRDHLHFNKPYTKEIPSKPEELMRILIKCFCRPGGRILDAFAGSGVVEEIAMTEGFEAVGIEIDQSRYSNIVDRIGNLEKKEI